MNIVLRSFNCPQSIILDAIDRLEFAFITPQRSHGLKNLILEPEDAQKLRSYTGDRTLLAEAEKFELGLLDVRSSMKVKLRDE